MATTDARDLAICRELMRGGSRTFFAASCVLPRRVRLPATALYSFCRVADDAIDGARAAGADPHAAMRSLHHRLDAVYAGDPRPEVADRALAAVLRAHPIPRLLFEALLEGFEWDAQGRRYETIEELHDYGARVAGTVGAMMAVLMETRERWALARACELGLAMQLTNIARDVGEDARAGRVYLPLRWLREAGVDVDAWLAAPRFDSRIAGVVARVLAEADRLYARAECGVAALPRDCRPAIQAARLVYAEIGRAIEGAGHDSVHRRAVVGSRRKLALIGRACTALVVAPGRPVAAEGTAEPMPAVRALVDVAASDELAARTFYQRTLRVLQIFERAEAHRRAGRHGVAAAGPAPAGPGPGPHAGPLGSLTPSGLNHAA
jgi:phytoene synthase